VGDLELSEPLIVTMSRHARGSAGRPLGASAGFPRLVFAIELNQPMRKLVDHATSQINQ